MSKVNRRQFLNASATTAAALGVSAATARAALGANEKVRIAVAGIHGRGAALIKSFTARKDVEVVCICDPDTNLFGEVVKSTADRQGRAPRTETDVRRVLEDKSIDALVVATPDHWHALATIWACQAGKDVYVEKPASHNVFEAQQMVRAARKYERVVQTGTQRRSAPHLPEVRELVRSGRLGHVGMVRTWIIDHRRVIGRPADSAAPSGVDYDLWLGPAAERPFNENRFHYEWHWHWDYGTGQLGNNGIHAVDLARAVLDFDLPTRVTAGGGIHFYEDDHETPDTQIVTWEYPRMTLVWEHRMWNDQPIEGAGWGVAIYGTKASLVLHSGGYKLYEDEGGKVVQEGGGGVGGRQHIDNFIDCMRSRNRPNCDIEQGYLSAALCHLGNIAHRLRRNLAFDPSAVRFADPDANRMLRRTYRPGFEVSDEV